MKDFWRFLLFSAILLISTTGVYAQKVTVSGTIRGTDQQVIPGATIVEKGTTNGTVSDVDGKFAIEVSPDAVLSISFVGMKSQEIPVGGQKIVNVILEEETFALDEVVAIGYGTQKKVNLTGAVGIVTAEALENRPIVNAFQALQGVTPGLNLTVNSSSSELGGSYDVNVRGYTSINGGSPLILIDGVRSSLQKLNTADIQTVTVLKDQASAAIYGAQAAYGVVMITTKSGQMGKMTLEYSNHIATRSPLVMPKNMNSLDFATYWNVAATNSNNSPYFDEDAINRIKAYLEDPENTPVAIPQPTNPNIWGKHWWSNANTDWYSAMYKQKVFDQQHNLSARGGTENIQYYVSGSYLQQDGLTRYGDPGFDKYTFDAKVDAKINNWSSIKVNSKYTTQAVERPTFLSSTFYGNISKRWPVNYIKDPNGHYSNFSEVKKLLEGGKHTEENTYYTNTGTLILEPVENWETNISLTKENVFGDFDETEIPVFEYGVDMTPVNVQGVSSYRTQKSKNDYTTVSVHTTYEKQINYHYFKGMTGWQYEHNKYSMVNGRRQELIVDNVPSLSSASGDQFATDDKYEWANNSFFGRLNYSFRDRYLVEINARADGSSFFPKESRWGFFPSISAGYILSEENYWTNLQKFVNFFKIRASYGELGNQSIASGSTNQRYYPYVATMPVTLNSYWIFPDNKRIHVNAPGLVSPDLTWETVKGFNVGATATSLSHRLSVDLEVYKRTTENMMGPVASLPAILGTSAPRANNATLSTTGYEILIGWKDQIVDFDYSFSVSLSDYQGKILKYNNPTMLNNTYYEGGKIGDIWGYVTEGLFQSAEEINEAPSQTSISSQTWMPGDVRYKDINGDGVINYGNNTVTNPGDRTIIGNTTPRYAYALNFACSWKNIDFNMFWQGIGKRDLWISNSLFWGATGGIWGGGGFQPHLDYWREDNRDAYYARPLEVDYQRNQQVQSRYLNNASYLRLKSLQLGYTIPAKIMNKISLQRCRIFIAGENLLTITKMHENFDPEVISNGISYPLQSAMSVGINLNF